MSPSDTNTFSLKDGTRKGDELIKFTFTTMPQSHVYKKKTRKKIFKRFYVLFYQIYNYTLITLYL